MALLSSTIHDSVLTIEFKDPTSRNSFSLRAAEELIATLRLHHGQFRALVFAAPGRVFCSGGNLADYAAMSSADDGREVNRRIGEALNTLAHLEVPTVCAIQGDCFGGGLELMSAFDLVLAAPHALFGFWQRKVGLTFGWGGGERLAKRLGEKTLQQFALGAATMGAAEALRTGLIDGIVFETRLMAQAEAQARRLQELPSAPVSEIKLLTPANEREAFNRLWWSPEHRAVLQQRKP